MGTSPTLIQTREGPIKIIINRDLTPLFEKRRWKELTMKVLKLDIYSFDKDFPVLIDQFKNFENQIDKFTTFLILNNWKDKTSLNFNILKLKLMLFLQLREDNSQILKTHTLKLIRSKVHIMKAPEI